MKKRRSPQEKKALSYQKDRRSDHGQNDKAARRLVPLRKALANRRLRHADKQALADIDAAVDDTPPPPKDRDRFEKWPDQKLGENVAGKLRDRQLLQDNPPTGRPGRARLNALKYPERASSEAWLRQVKDELAERPRAAVRDEKDQA